MKIISDCKIREWMNLKFESPLYLKGFIVARMVNIGDNFSKDGGN